MKKVSSTLGFLSCAVLGASAAFADGQPAAGPSMVEMLVMPAGFLLIMYFFMIRPQQKKAKEHQAFLAALKPGDEVVAAGGIIGRIKSVADQFVSVEVAGNTVIKVLKTAIDIHSTKSAVPAKSE